MRAVGFLFVASLALVGACHEARPGETRVERERDASESSSTPPPRRDATSLASVAVDSGPTDSGKAPPPELCVDVAGEPRAPEVECTFKRVVRCVPPFPVRSAWQKDFPACPVSLPVAAPPTMRFSACETLARSARGDGRCCYIEFERGLCR